MNKITWFIKKKKKKEVTLCSAGGTPTCKKSNFF